MNKDISELQFSSKAFPTDADMTLWDSLNPKEQRAVIARDEEAGFASGPASQENVQARIERIKALSHAL